LPIGGATVLEEGAKGFELVEFNVSIGTRSSSPGLGPTLRSHSPVLELYVHRRHGGADGQALEGAAKASDAIPKKNEKQSIKAIMLLLSS
jgi:hypothetical protein